MKKIVHTLAMTVMLYHLLVGCCVHHAHSDTALWASEIQTATCCHHDHGRGDHRQGHSLPHNSSGEPEGCKGAKCAFVVPPLDGRSPLLQWGQDPGLTAPLAAGHAIAPASTRPTLEHSLPGGPPPVPLHLAHQVLLI